MFLFLIIGIGYLIGKLGAGGVKLGSSIGVLFVALYFGHMGFNNKDTILAFSHVWITYYIFRYIKYQNYSNKVNKYILSIALLAALATGIQLVFLGSLIPIFFLLAIDISVCKKLTFIKFNLKKFFMILLNVLLYFIFS